MKVKLMTPTFNSSTLELLGYSDPTRKQSTSSFDVYSASVAAGIESFPAQFLYVKTRANKSDLSKAQLRRDIPLFVVTPESSTIEIGDVANLSQTVKLFKLDELIWTRIKTAFDEYVIQLNEGLVVEPHFVQPRTESADSKPDKDIIDFLTARSDTYIAGTVLVVRAPAAVGKTTLCRKIVKRLLESRDAYQTIPLFIESAHWAQLRLETISDLWEVVRNSISRFAPTLAITRSLFETALKTGRLVFIFDGLDELCGQRDVQLSAVDVVDEIATIADGTNARVLLTTRTAYWESEINRSWANVVKLDLAPFNKQQALSYFDRRFTNDLGRKTSCKQIYQRVLQTSLAPRTPGGSRAQFANLPACVNLIADIVEQDSDSARAIDVTSPQKVAESMLSFLCGRDKQRKTLSTPPKVQLIAFSSLAAASPLSSGLYNLELLEATGFDESDIDKLKDHPLIRMHSPPYFEFGYEFLDPFFKASFLTAYFRDEGSAVGNDAIELMKANSNGKTSIIEHLVGMDDGLSSRSA